MTINMAAAKTVSVAPKPTPIEVAAEQLLAQRRCLAEAMYYEARGEGTVGEIDFSFEGVWTLVWFASDGKYRVAPAPHLPC